MVYAQNCVRVSVGQTSIESAKMERMKRLGLRISEVSHDAPLIVHDRSFEIINSACFNRISEIIPNIRGPNLGFPVQFYPE
jgi:hypothetical protein